MSIAPLPADLEQGADGLVEMERELTRLLVEYDELRTAWPKGDHVLVRAKIGRQSCRLTGEVRLGDEKLGQMGLQTRSNHLLRSSHGRSH